MPPFGLPGLLDFNASSDAFRRFAEETMAKNTAATDDATRAEMERTRAALDQGAAANREPEGATRRGSDLGLLSGEGIPAMVQRMLGGGSVPQPGGQPGAQPPGETGSVPPRGAGGGGGGLGRLIDSFANPLTMAGLATLGSFDRDPGKGFRAADDFSAAQRRFQIGQEPPAGGGSGPSRPSPTSAAERVAARLMQDDPSLTYADAIARARRAPTNDTGRYESLAQSAARRDPDFDNDPTGTLERWRSQYGLPSRGTSGGPSAGAANPADRVRVIQDAHAAIARGADRAAVRKRLEDLGVDPAELGL